MILRDYQSIFVADALRALQERNNTLGVSPTGSGKTIILSSVIDEMLIGMDRAVVVQHRDELIRQNTATFQKVTDRPISIYNGQVKSWDGQVTFASIQTLSRPEHLKKMKPVSLLVYDEAHHSKAKSYLALTERAKELNPDVKIFGVTATPERGDKKGLKPTFDNVCAILQLEDMVRKGHIVKPEGRVINLGIQTELKAAQKNIKSDFADQTQIEAIMNTQATNNAIVKHWKEHAGDRQTVFFCASIKHSEDVAACFQESGIEAMAIHSKLNKNSRADALADFESGKIQVLTNPMILTEGYDSPVCSCVGLLRSCSHRSTMIQMCGRGLRKNPNAVKDDCIILDYGLSLLTHGNLETNILLDDKKKGKSPMKLCPQCETSVPASCKYCPICGYLFEEDGEGSEKIEIEDFVLTPFQLIGKSPFKWISLFPGDAVQMACGFDAWSLVCTPDQKKTWFAIGGRKDNKQVTRLSISSDEAAAITTADDFLREHETNDSAKKVSKWMHQPATQTQDKWLKKFGYEIQPVFGSGKSKIEAVAALEFAFNRKKIEGLLNV